MANILNTSTDFKDYVALARTKYHCPGDYVINLDQYMHAKKGRDFNGLISTVGCQGVAGCYTKKKFEGASPAVQCGIGQAAAAHNADFSFLLGDNFYDDGISDANVDSQFREAFKKPYADNNLDCFTVLGNHDYYIHGNTPWGSHGKNKFWGAVISPVKYKHSTPAYTLMRGLRQVNLSYNNRRAGAAAWNMPFRYYALFSQVADFFILDSNCFFFDRAQCEWLQRVYSMSRAPKKVLVMHHPICSAGKRMGSMKDFKMYAKAFGVDPTTIDSAIYGSGEMGKMIAWWINGRNMHFDYLLCAHDHILTVDSLVMGNDRSKMTIQMISGGGGGPISTKASDQHKIDNVRKAEQEALGCYTSFIEGRYGFHTLNLATGQIGVYDERGGQLFST